MRTIVFVENLNEYKNTLLEEMAEIVELTLLTNENQPLPSGFKKILTVGLESRSPTLSKKSWLQAWFTLASVSNNSRREILTAARISQVRFGGGYTGWVGHWSIVFSTTMRALSSIDACAALIWCEFTAKSRVFSAACKDKSIKVAYFEYGVFPGTLTASDGQVGAHWARKKPDVFSQIAVDNKDISNAKRLVRAIREKNNVPISKAESFLGDKEIRPRKLLFVANHHPHSGVLDKNKFRANLQGGKWSGNFNAFKRLTKVASGFGVEITYRTHPLWNKAPKKVSEGVNVCLANSKESIAAAILKSDIVVTLNSTAAFLAVILGKDLLIMGGLPISSSRFVYEASSDQLIRKSLKEIVYGCESKIIDETELVGFFSRWIKSEVYALRGEIFGIRTNSFETLGNDIEQWSKSRKGSLDAIKMSRVGVFDHRENQEYKTVH